MRDDCQNGSLDCGPYGFTTCPDCRGQGCCDCSGEADAICPVCCPSAFQGKPTPVCCQLDWCGKTSNKEGCCGSCNGPRYCSGCEGCTAAGCHEPPGIKGESLRDADRPPAADPGRPRGQAP